MAGSLAAIRTKVQTLLETLTGSGQPVAFVYNHYEKDVEGYPCIMHEPSTVDAAYEDTANNLRGYNLDIYVVQELTNTARDVALDRMVTIVDAVLDAFDQDFTLTGTCKAGISAVPGEFAEADMEDGPVLFSTIRLVCRDLVDIT